MFRNNGPKVDNFTAFMRRAGEGREDFWILRWLRRTRRTPARPPEGGGVRGPAAAAPGGAPPTGP